MALIDRSILLIERGTPAIVAEADWQSLNLDEPCRILTEKKIIGLKKVGGFQIIEPRQFVGHLRLPGRAITVSPSDKELFTALHSFVTFPPEKTVISEDKSVRSKDVHLLDIALTFVKAFLEVVNVGLPFSYERRTLETTHPRGRLLVSQTLRSLHSHGISHRVVCSVAEKGYDKDLGSILKTVASFLKTDFDLPVHSWQQLDQLIALFGEDSQVLSMTDVEDTIMNEMNVYTDRAELVRLLEICQAIISNERVVWDTEIPVLDGECRFCNMDRLWELAIWTALRKSPASSENDSTEFHPLSRSDLNLLTPGGPKIDPDIVVFRSGRPLIVIDAKYSERTTPSAADVYQIVCYAQRLKANRGVLIYLSPGENWFRHLGRTSEEIEIDAAGVAITGVDVNLVSLADKFFASEPKN